MPRVGWRISEKRILSTPSSYPYLFLVRLSGELSIKARGTRNRFTSRLMRNLRDALESAGVDFEVRRTWSRLFVHATSEDAIEVIRRVFGVSSVSRVEHRTWRTIDDLVEAGEELFASTVAGKKFAVRARRGDKRHIPFHSTELERELGARLLPHAAGVDLGTPEVRVQVEVRTGDAYFYTDRKSAGGGLPIGVEGKAVALVSGGFDSIVAAWLLLRRGVDFDYVFCNLGGTPHRDGVLRVMKVLADRWSYGTRPRLHMVDFQPLVEELEARCETHLWQIVLKRHMLRVAERIAGEVRAIAIVTGEAVGQVSSQTLQNLGVISQVTRLPILRPLVGTHKEEIFDWARLIGSFDLSAKVPEYCALVPHRPATHATGERVERAEQGLDLGRLDLLADERAVLDLRALDLDKLSAPELEVETVPDGATVVDLRSAHAFRSWHYPNALRMGYFEALKACRSFDRDQTYLFYCEVGLKSAHLAEVMHEAGFRAFHFKDGLKSLLRCAESRQDPALRAALSPALRGE